MSEDANPVQIFISYARDDDYPPPEAPESGGFVSTLHDQLLYEFKGLGHPRPKLWRDTKKIEKAHQFEPRIVQAINESTFLLVVLSNNWMASEWCRRELETFAERWRGDPGLRERIVVASKRCVDRNKRPSLLQGQTGYDFFRRLDDPGDDGLEQEFFSRGRARDRRYYDVIEELAGVLWRMAARKVAKPGEKVQTPKEPPRPPSPTPNGRTVYVAKPASDMLAAYDRVAKELVDRGFAVVPDPAAEIPGDCSALALIDEQLAKAEISVHLLGEKYGFTPEDQDKPIVKLQLERAAAREQNCVHAVDDNGGVPFLRFVWAPKILDEETATNARERDPDIVLINFTDRLDSDKVIGDNISKFVIALIDNVVKNGPKSVPKPIPDGSRVYLYHAEEDTDWAMELAGGFELREVDPVLPVFKGSPAEIADFHRKQLLKCDAVVVCWAAASEVWARAHTDELRDWVGLGRSEKFAYRSLIAGPPPDTRKNPAKRMFFSRKEIDVVIDLTASSHPTSEALDPLFTTSA